MRVWLWAIGGESESNSQCAGGARAASAGRHGSCGVVLLAIAEGGAPDAGVVGAIGEREQQQQGGRACGAARAAMRRRARHATSSAACDGERGHATASAAGDGERGRRRRARPCNVERGMRRRGRRRGSAAVAEGVLGRRAACSQLHPSGCSEAARVRTSSWCRLRRSAALERHAVLATPPTRPR